jgi:hypothetical protein
MPKIRRIFKSNNVELVREYIKKNYIKTIKNTVVLKYAVNGFNKKIIKTILMAGYQPINIEEGNTLKHLLNLLLNNNKKLASDISYLTLAIKILNLIIKYGAVVPSKQSLTLAVRTRCWQVVQIISKLSIHNLKYDERTLGYAFKSDNVEIVRAVSNVGIIPYFNIPEFQVMSNNKNYDLDSVNHHVKHHEKKCIMCKRASYLSKQSFIKNVSKNHKHMKMEKIIEIYKSRRNLTLSYDFEYAVQNEKYDIVQLAIILGCRPFNPEYYKSELLRSWGQFAFNPITYSKILLLFLCIGIDTLTYYSQISDCKFNVLNIEDLIKNKKLYPTLVKEIKEIAEDLEANTVCCITVNQLRDVLFSQHWALTINCVCTIFDYYCEFVNTVPYIMPIWIRNL